MLSRVLRIKIYQPSANFRISFGVKRKYTYPIPPYSTIIGFLCNVNGIKEQNERFLKFFNGIGMSVLGDFSTISSEFIWFRNLEKDQHKRRFGSTDSRIQSNQYEHIGGIMPTKVDVLNDLRLIIYLSHHDYQVLDEIKENLFTLSKRFDVLHLGRAEDWIVLESIDYVDLVEEEYAGNFRYFTWITRESISKEYQEYYENLDYNAYIVPSIYKIRDGRRVFKFVEAKLVEKLIPPIEIGKKIRCLVDEIQEEGQNKKIPVFLHFLSFD